MGRHRYQKWEKGDIVGINLVIDLRNTQSSRNRQKPSSNCNNHRKLQRCNLHGAFFVASAGLQDYVWQGMQSVTAPSNPAPVTTAAYRLYDSSFATYLFFFCFLEDFDLLPLLLLLLLDLLLLDLLLLDLDFCYQ